MLGKFRLKNFKETGRKGRRKKRNVAISSVVGAIILFGMIFTIGFGYLYTLSQDQQIYQKAIKQNNLNLQLRNAENLYIQTNLYGQQLEFSVNNTGIPATLISYMVIDQSGRVVTYKNSTASGTILACSPVSAMLPCTVNQGASALFITNANYSIGGHLTVKVLTSRGNTVIGTYPAQFLTSSSVNSIVASGLGSLEMVFSSFTFYTYSAMGNPWKVNLASAQSAAITPYGVPLVFSVQFTNNDPSGGTIFIDSHTDLWTFLSCGGGCGTQQLLTFYVMNVAPDGTITSVNQGSFVPIQIPYGTTKTIFFGAASDLSLSTYSSQSVTDSASFPYNEFDVFLIFSGSLVSAKNSTLYSQNLPFAATFSSDNIALYSQTPTQCGNGTQTQFALTVTNSGYSSNKFNQVVVQAGPFFSSLQAVSANGWTYQITNGIITWTTNSNFTSPGSSITFRWSGTSPIVHNGTQVTFPSTVYWNGGSSTITSQLITTGCYVS